ADAFKQLQRAAGCFAAAHDMVRPAIWGLDPRWEPASLSPDLGLEMLSALRDLMLAQAQHAFHQKALDEGIRAPWRCSEQRLFTGAAAVDEGTSPSVRAKLAEQAALLFGAALRTLDSQELRDY
ncbi:hypothetical protein EMIHUDRAFT_257193, partial [Emiliania huxleyi CCMP1516]|uniref:BRO1 domain-containing protein n=2 Tax=Emiliania huxleyi TaxID=2903 RepID=A0A0D3ILZ9_EMIH1